MVLASHIWGRSRAARGVLSLLAVLAMGGCVEERVPPPKGGDNPDAQVRLWGLPDFAGRHYSGGPDDGLLRVPPPVEQPGSGNPDEDDAGVEQERTVPEELVVRFSDPSSVLTYPHPSAIGTGDFDGDGRADLVASHDEWLFVIHQTADGELVYDPADSVPLPPGASGTSLVVVDLNGDGADDVALNLQTGVGVAYQHEGRLGPIVVHDGSDAGFGDVSHVDSGDMDNDGLADLVMIDRGIQSKQAGIMLQLEAGGFGAPFDHEVPRGGFEDMDIGDVNGDGLDDLVMVRDRSSPTCAVALQAADGGLQPTRTYDIDVGLLVAHGVAVGDVTGDGVADIVLSFGMIPFGGEALIGVLSLDADGEVQAFDQYEGSDIHGPVVVADINADGRGDVVVDCYSWDSISVRIQGPDGRLARKQVFTTRGSPAGFNLDLIAVADFNGDDLPDIALLRRPPINVFYQRP